MYLDFTRNELKCTLPYSIGLKTKKLVFLAVFLLGWICKNNDMFSVSSWLYLSLSMGWHELLWHFWNDRLQYMCTVHTFGCICNTHTDGQCRAQASPRNRSIWFWHIFVFSSLRTHCRHSAALKLFWLICFQGFPLIFKPLSEGRLWHPSFTFSMALEKADSEVSPAVFHFRQIGFNFQPQHYNPIWF